MSEPEILHLTLHKKWFDMILNGEKREEYRKDTPYWSKRLVSRPFTHIRFVNGYGNHRPWMLVVLKSISFSLGIMEWGAPEEEVVNILHLGAVVETGNILDL